MEIGVQIPNFTYPSDDIPGTLREIAKFVDSMGAKSLWVMDHYYQIDNLFGLSYRDPMLEGYSALNFLAGITNKVKLGTLVTGVIYRNPAFLVKQLTTLDVLSEGRAYLGIGAAWYKEEAEAYGFPFPSTSTRFEMLEEQLQIAKLMFSQRNEPYEGKHYKLGNSLNSPEPVQKPHPPIMIGGMGEQKTLRMVAQYADATNLFARAGVNVLEHKLEVLQGHCSRLGRDYNEIERTSLGTIDLRKQDMDQIITDTKSLAGIGIQHAIFNFPNIHEIEPLEKIRDELIPAVADL